MATEAAGGARNPARKRATIRLWFGLSDHPELPDLADLRIMLLPDSVAQLDLVDLDSASPWTEVSEHLFVADDAELSAGETYVFNDATSNRSAVEFVAG